MSNYYRYKKVVPANSEQPIDYKDIETLQMYILEGGRIIPGRITGTSPHKQRQIVRAIKIARYLALLPYTDQH